MSRTKASFSQFQCTGFQGSLARNAFLKDSGCAKYVVLQDKTRVRKWIGKVCRATRDGCETVSTMLGSCSDQPLIGTDNSNFVFTTSSCSFWRKSCRKISLSPNYRLKQISKVGSKTAFQNCFQNFNSLGFLWSHMRIYIRRCLTPSKQPMVFVQISSFGAVLEI